MEERPWPEWKNGRPITTRQLAGQGRLFQEGEIQPNSSGIDPALVSDWPEIERQFGWLVNPDREDR